MHLLDMLQGIAHVRHLDWQEALNLESRSGAHKTLATESTEGAVEGAHAGAAPVLASQDKFSVILGTDIMYEVCCRGRECCIALSSC